MADSNSTKANEPSPLSSSSTHQFPPQHQLRQSNSPMSSFLAGFAGGSASTILLYPLDLIKVRMQVDERRCNSFLGSVAKSRAVAAPTSSTIDAGMATATDKPRTICTTVRGVIRYEGYLGLYRGLTPAIIGSAASWGGFFILYEQMKSQMLLRKNARDVSNNLLITSIEEEYDLTKDMHVDEEMDINTNATRSRKINASNSIQSINKNTTETKQQVRLGPIEHFSASCLAGACMVALTNPIWLIKTRLQLQNSHLQQQLSQPLTATKATQQLKPAYRGLFHATYTIVQEEGVLALYNGSVPALMLVSHGGIQFVTYEFLKGHFAIFTNNDKNSGNQLKESGGRTKCTIGERLRNSVGYLVMGAVSKFVASTTTYPIQVVKARLQQRSQVVEFSDTTGEIIITKREYSGVLDCVGKILRNEGIYGFFKGCLTNAIRVAPSAAITFVTYEFVLDLLTEN